MGLVLAFVFQFSICKYGKAGVTSQKVPRHKSFPWWRFITKTISRLSLIIVETRSSQSFTRDWKLCYLLVCINCSFLRYKLNYHHKTLLIHFDMTSRHGRSSLFCLLPCFLLAWLGIIKTRVQWQAHLRMKNTETHGWLVPTSRCCYHKEKEKRKADVYSIGDFLRVILAFVLRSTTDHHRLLCVATPLYSIPRRISDDNSFPNRDVLNTMLTRFYFGRKREGKSVVWLLKFTRFAHPIWSSPVRTCIKLKEERKERSLYSFVK